jgi:hypothetical protein
MSRSLLFKFKNVNRNYHFIGDEPPNNMAMYLLSLIVVGHGIYTYSTSKTKDIIVKKKYTFCRNGFTEFIVVDKSGKHYNVNNSVWYWKWNSIEDWNNIEPNQNLAIRYYGIRLPLLGLFPNIVRSQEYVKTYSQRHLQEQGQIQDNPPGNYEY